MQAAPLITLLACLLAADGFGQARATDLEKAGKLIVDQKWDAASRTLDTAARQPGNQRELVLRILELQGVVFAQLGQQVKAKLAFQRLLSLDPRRDLSGRYDGKVLPPLTAAQAWAKANPPLDFAPEPAAVDGTGRVMQLAAKLKADPLKLGRKVRFSFRPDQLKWTDVDVDLQGPYAAAGTQCDGVEWYADLLGDHDAVLVTIGSQKQPFLEGAAVRYARREPEKRADAPVVEPPKPRAEVTPEALPVEAPRPQLTTGTSTKGSALRPVGYVLLGAGVASAAVGVYFGLQAQQARFTLQNPVVDGNGVQTSPTQRETFALQDSLRRNAMVATALFIAGGVLAATGGVFVLVGRDTTVSAGAGGLVVRGTLP